ncbi:hypothetical protein [Halobacillus litoralis]|uniref:hypothetical protein n=1 Tax=Halobacillus litoralis TaxID=45668 RepID=UPI0024912E98|nr:hypothetical protein [Halobacillus litoralis]
MVVFLGLSILILLGAVLSYFAARQGLKKNEKVFENIFSALCIICLFGLASALIWFKYAGPINEFFLFGGMLFLIGITVICLVILPIILLVRKEKLIDSKG